MIEKEIAYFKQTGFFAEKEEALDLLKEVDKVLTEEKVEYSIMFGTLLGLLRHNDIIPWDDDIDIIIFDYQKFIKTCKSKLSRKGYIILPDMRRTGRLMPFRKRYGCRIFHKNGSEVPKRKMRFPWAGVWEHETDNGLISLPPESRQYRRDDFFPLKRRNFRDFSLMTPHKPENVLDTYFQTNDWNEFCVPTELIHREARPSNFPQKKFRLDEVMRHLKNGL